MAFTRRIAGVAASRHSVPTYEDGEFAEPCLCRRMGSAPLVMLARPPPRAVPAKRSRPRAPCSFSPYCRIRFGMGQRLTTSGHGVCGPVAALDALLVATITFMGDGNRDRAYRSGIGVKRLDVVLCCNCDRLIFGLGLLISGMSDEHRSQASLGSRRLGSGTGIRGSPSYGGRGRRDFCGSNGF